VRYTYYLLDNGAGVPHEIYRSPASQEPFERRMLERARKDGTWSGRDEEVRIVKDRWLCGDFDPESDEIAEGEALHFLHEWRMNNWPGRA
jgi:hypothetical protein